MNDVSIHTHIPIIGKQYDLRMRKKKEKYGLVVMTTGYNGTRKRFSD
jgi:hypothetical protein